MRPLSSSRVPAQHSDGQQWVASTFSRPSAPVDDRALKKRSLLSRLATWLRGDVADDWRATGSIINRLQNT